MDIEDETHENDNVMDTGINYNNNTQFIMDPRLPIPITEEFAPEYPYKILDNLTNVINTPGIKFDDIITFVRNQNWKGIYQLYNINNDDNNERAESFANNINNSLTEISEQYNSRYVIIINENSRHQISRLTNLFIDETNNLIDNITKKVEENIDKEKIKREKLSIINFLKGKIGEIYTTNPESLYLYDLTINQIDTDNALEKNIDIQLKYTELGVILMLKTELLHDLSPPILDKETTGNLQNDLNELIRANSPFRALLDKEDGKPITYTEEISTELILYISSLQGINRIYRQNDVDTVTRDNEKKLGSSILPAIFNNNNISITSDADNTAALIFSQISKNMKLENNTSKIYPFLNLDAGSAPSLHGFTESFVRQAQLENLKRNNDDNNDENNTDSTKVPNISGVKITIKDPLNYIMLTMENNNILNNPNYRINCTGFNSFTLNELSITNVSEKINNPPYSVTSSEISKKKKTTKLPSVLNIAIIKSIGDLIPYQVVNFFRALNPRSDENLNELLNIVSSRDYSMIFQIISNVQYFINQQDYTYNLNDKKIIVGCNLSNANAFFPFSERMNKIFNYMSIIVNDQQYINLKNDIIKNASACFFCPINGSIKVSPKSNSNNPSMQNISGNIFSFLNVKNQDENDCYINNIDNDQFILLNERYKNFLYNNDLCNFDELINKIENDDKLNKNFNIDCLKKLNDKINNGVKNLYNILNNKSGDTLDNKMQLNYDDDDTNEYNIDNIDYCIAIKLYNLVNNQKVSSNMDTARGGTKKNHKQPKKYKSYNRKNKTKFNRKSKKHNNSNNKRKPNKTQRKHR
jgi:hypothetical protein